MICLIMLLIESIDVSAATVYPNVVPNWTKERVLSWSYGSSFIPPSEIGGSIIPGASESNVIMSNSLMEPVSMVFSQSIFLNQWLSPSKSYNFSFNFVEDYSTGLDSEFSVMGINHYILVGGNRYDFGESDSGNWDIFVSEGISTNHVILCTEFSGVMMRKSRDVRFSRFSFVRSNISYSLSEVSNASPIVNSIQEGNSLQNQGNMLQQEANETSKGILGGMTDFFGSFFENIMNSFKSLFIPEDSYFESFFIRLNDFFSEKLGALYAPIDFFVRLFSAVSSADSSVPGLEFPGVQWDGVYIIPKQTVNFSSYSESFPGLQSNIYFVTDVILIGAVFLLLQTKLKEVLSG